MSDKWNDKNRRRMLKQRSLTCSERRNESKRKRLTQNIDLKKKRKEFKVNVNAEEVFVNSVVFLDGAGAFLPRKFTL